MANHRFHLKAQLQGWAFFLHLGEVLWSPRTLTLAALIAPVRKRSFLSTLYTKMMIIPPRQARDKHRESSTQKRKSAVAFSCRRVRRRRSSRWRPRHSSWLSGLQGTLAAGKEAPLFAPFIYYKMHHFTKTGSGQI